MDGLERHWALRDRIDALAITIGINTIMLVLGLAFGSLWVFVLIGVLISAIVVVFDEPIRVVPPEGNDHITSRETFWICIAFWMFYGGVALGHWLLWGDDHPIRSQQIGIGMLGIGAISTLFTVRSFINCRIRQLAFPDP